MSCHFLSSYVFSSSSAVIIIIIIIIFIFITNVILMIVTIIVLIVSLSYPIIIKLYDGNIEEKTKKKNNSHYHPGLSSNNATTIINGPTALPIVGSLHLLTGYDNPFEAFTELAKKYGPIYRIRLGSLECVVVNNYEAIKDVLMKRGNQFDGRPDYIRYNKLFGGDRNNSLALCDFTDLQKTRRHIARLYCSPKLSSHNYQLLETVSTDELNNFLEEINRHFETRSNRQTSSIVVSVHLKPLVAYACFNMFTQYMCTVSFPYDNKDIRRIVRYYDEIFWDINQGYAVDFMPWLAPFYSKHMRTLDHWSKEIRRFISDNIVEERKNSIDYDVEPRDFTDALFYNLREDDTTLEWKHIMYELEDFLGGHSAIANLVMLTLICLIKFPSAKEKIVREIFHVTNNTRNVNLSDKPQLVYTEATIFETLRFNSSPIVPHVATEDTDIKGKFIRKGTCVILNNYEINKSNQYWNDACSFLPERFIKNGTVIKPSYFIPFGTGKRTCMGQQLVQGFALVLVAGIIQNYDVAIEHPKYLKTKPACVALPPKTFPFILTKK